MGIEKKLIKSITSEFFEKLEKDNGLFFSNFKNSLRVTKSAKKLFERSKTFLKNKTKTNAIHYSEFGTVKKPILGFTLLHATGNYNPQKEWDEETIGAGSWFIEKLPPNIFKSEKVDFLISRHLIERMIERHSDFESISFDKISRIIKEELKFVPVFVSLIKMFYMYEIIHGNVSKTLEKQNSHISFPIPAINGFFISHVYNGLPYLRTFLSVEELNPNQKELLELMSKIIPKYENLNLPYLLEERYLENDEVFVYFLLSAIFIEVGVIFKKIIPNSIEDKIPQGQKANMIKKLISLVENFPRKWQDVPIEKDDDQYKEFLEKLEQGNFSDYSKLKTKKMRQFMRSHK